MDFRLKFAKAWPYRDPKRGRTTLAPGTYAVPEALSHAVAERALAEGVAKRIDTPRPSAAVVQRKAPVRKKKALGPAPENKSALG